MRNQSDPRAANHKRPSCSSQALVRLFAGNRKLQRLPLFLGTVCTSIHNQLSQAHEIPRGFVYSPTFTSEGPLPALFRFSQDLPALDSHYRCLMFSVVPFLEQSPTRTSRTASKTIRGILRCQDPTPLGRRRNSSLAAPLGMPR